MGVKPGKVKGTMVLDIVKFLFDIMQTVSFMMFIEEEGIQIRGFGIMSLMREGLADEAAVQVDALEVQVNNLENFADSWGWIAPYMRPTYLGYAQAARDQVDAWRAWVASVQAKEEKYGIRIISSPTQAEITVDGTKTDFLTPHAFYDLPKKKTTFELRYESTRRGIGTYTEDVVIEADIIKEVRCILEGFDVPEEPPEPRPKTGIRIISSPSGAEIFIDGSTTDKLTPETFRAPPLSIGKHTFELRYMSTSKGLMTYEEDITLEEDVLKEFRWILEET